MKYSAAEFEQIIIFLQYAI